MNEPETSDSIKSDPSARPALVLAVDDEPANLWVIEAALESHSCDMAFATSAAAAILAAQERRPSLVLLDVMMPGESGLELCRYWRRDPTMDNTPVILVTALGADGHRAAGLQAGADDFLEKPLDIDVLLARVASWLARNRGPKTEAVARDTEGSIHSRLLAAARDIAPDGPTVTVARAMARAVGLDTVAAELALTGRSLLSERRP